MNATPFLLIALLVPISGCLQFEPERKYGGVGFTTITLYDTRVYKRVWANEYPEGGPAGNEEAIGPYEDPSRHAGSTVFHCVREGDQSYPKENYILEDNWIRVTIYELELGPFGEGPGRELASKRWDGLECFKGYTFILTEALELQLYRCSHCRTPEERWGLEPLTPSEANDGRSTN